MNKKVASTKGKQGKTTAPVPFADAVNQIVLPLFVGIEATKNGLLAFVHQMGMIALRELLAADAEAIAGPKGKRNAGRTHHHWGTTNASLPFGGRHVIVERPRVRRKGGGEVALPVVESFKSADPLPARVMEQVLLGVSTRGYGDSLDAIPDDVRAKGTSKSAASRALVEKTSEKLAEFVARRLEDVEVIAMFLDAIEIAGKCVIVALGVTTDGTKVPLGLALGSTENASVATELLQGLLARGLRIDAPTLFVIDGGKGIRKALSDVFGNRAVVQRCQVHKMRNVHDHLPEARRSYVLKQMRAAYKSASAKTAKKQLLQLVSWLEANGEDSTAASVREGLDETLTVLRLGLPKMLCRTFSTTNAIENMNGTLRRVARNVKHWRGESMIGRWVALGIAQAAKKFRRVKGHQHMAALVRILRPESSSLEVESKVA
jgi:transposase-like protein